MLYNKQLFTAMDGNQRTAIELHTRHLTNFGGFAIRHEEVNGKKRDFIVIRASDESDNFDVTIKIYFNCHQNYRTIANCAVIGYTVDAYPILGYEREQSDGCLYPIYGQRHRTAKAAGASTLVDDAWLDATRDLWSWAAREFGFAQA